MADITFTDKNKSGSGIVTQWRDVDANEVKRVVNTKSDKLGTFASLAGTAWDGTPKSKTLTTNTALTFSTALNSGILIIKQDGTGGRTLTINGTSADINTGANEVTVISFVYVASLTTYVFTADKNVLGVTGSAPAAPTNGFVDDTSNTFDFDENPSFTLSQHEYSINGGAYATVTSNPISVGDIAIPIGQLLVRVKSIGGNPASATLANSSAFTVAIGGDVTPPTITSATVENATPARIDINYNETLNSGSVPATSAFAVSGGRTVSSVAIIGGSVQVTVNTAYSSSDTVTISYTVPGSNQIKDVAGNNAAAFTNHAVTNNISSGYDTNAQTYFTAVAAAGVTLSTADKDAYNAWVVAEKAASRYTKYAAIYPFMGGTAATNAINAKTPGTNDLSFTGTWTHNASGSKSDGANSSYALTGITPSTVGSLNSFHMSLYINQDSANGFDMGAYTVGESDTLAAYGTDNFTNCNSGASNTTSNAGGMLGNHIVTRVASTEYLYVKAGSVRTITETSTARSVAVMGIGNVNPLLNGGSARRYAFSTIGTGLTSSESTGATTNTNTLQTALSRA